jgi:hypothetical protein
MRKIVFILLTQIIVYQAYAQIDSRDSIYFQGRYYKPDEYRNAKNEYDKYNFDKRFMPGIGYSYFKPAKSDSIGNFDGITVKYLFYRDVSQNQDPGPSHLTFYAKLSLLKSSEANFSQIFLYSMGLDLSFEKDPHRYYFIPFFGLEVGGLSQKSYGTTIQFTPTVGLHLISKKNFTLDFSGGYVYPVKNFEHLAGWYGDLCVNFVLW